MSEQGYAKYLLSCPVGSSKITVVFNSWEIIVKGLFQCEYLHRERVGSVLWEGKDQPVLLKTVNDRGTGCI